MQFYENELIEEVIDSYVETWRHTLDTGEFVDEKFLKHIDNFIFKKMQLKFKEVEIYKLLYLKERGYKLGLFKRLKIYFSGLKPLYLADKKDYEEYLSREREKQQNAKQ